MQSPPKILVISGLSALVLCSSLDALARRHRSESKKPVPTTEQPADQSTTPQPPAGASAAPASKGTPAGPPAAATGALPGPSAGQPRTAAPVAAPPPSAIPPPAAAPKELAADVSGPRQEAARAHFERGVELYTNGDFPNAWLEFNSAYQIVSLVDLLNNLARCEVRMGRRREALEHFQRFISARPNDPDREYINQEIARLEGELGRTQSAPPIVETQNLPPPSPPRRIPVYGIMTGAATLAFLIAGAATLGVVNTTFNNLQYCAPSCNVVDVGVLERQAYAGYGLFGVAGAGAVATGVILYLELRGGKEAALRPLAGLRLSSPIGVVGRF